MYHILLVEDEKLVRDFITEYFNKREIKVIEATNGYEAISLINEKIDLILLDIMMPGIDGYEVCKQIRSSSNIPIIFISALSLDDNQLLAYQLGADDYITKPFKPSILYAKCLAMIKRNYHDDLNDIIKYGLIKLDNNFHQVIVDGKEKSLLQRSTLC
ncbi:response regulator transcription factor [Thomasclavelia cocleata]|jgi:DNA-binding response OmpR family regulator|uniref:response regulator transcription factor n=1 Tax=Thomasclavelia cocleata TaxID=69824 RepID=UPI0024327D63|nr:response regulator transcription factor [Thomasclavelia cocleata]